jgi:single-stranded-DNA-specific exonuclease
MTSDWTIQRWRCASQSLAPRQQQAFDQLVNDLRLPPILARLLLQRGLSEPAAAQAFLKVRLIDLHDPMTLPGIDVATRRLHKAIRDRQPIVIYGDYDVDGVTASAILYHTLTLAGGNVQTYVPHRIEEGYGLNCQAIQSLCDDLPHGPDGGVIVSVDCGITAAEPAAIAKAANVDLIITDHHHLDPANLPDALALVHPGLPGSAYPFADLCGAGVALKLAWAFARLHCGSDRLPQPFRDLMLDMLSLAALGTVADVVPLVGENRIITTYGLGRIKHTAIHGLNAMIDAASLREEKVSAYHVGFVLGPRLNACGRMGHAQKAVHLLTRAQGDEAGEIATFLTRENKQRQAVEKDITQQAKALVTQQGYDRPDSRVIVVAGKGWHQGVVGIVASRLVDSFHRPAIVLSIDEHDQAHGSARSVEGLSIHDALTHAATHLTSFGGHAMAAGMHLPASQIESLRQALLTHVNARLSEEDLLPVIHADVLCELSDLTDHAVMTLERLAPFGRANPQPTFGLSRVRLAQPPRRLGASGHHLALILTDGHVTLRAIGFGLGDLAPKLPAGSIVDIAATAKVSRWQGQSRTELELQAIRLSDEKQAWQIVDAEASVIPVQSLCTF